MLTSVPMITYQGSVNCDFLSFADDEGEEDESEKPYVRLSDENRKHKPYYYGRQISKLGKAGKVCYIILICNTMVFNRFCISLNLSFPSAVGMEWVIESLIFVC
jgi:hypothetical protein